ncbi:MAG TPA: hypothetical protein VMW17_25030 [Candidatus Binatia bacterium]|nr:hypothetical protein [Candidatus Binatia bacterium]
MAELGDHSTRPVLVIGHPGHELRVHGWLETQQPSVFVLTDGSRHAGRSRLQSTTRVLTAAGARPGAIYGRFSDREIYAAILERRFDVFVQLAEDLAGVLVADRVEWVASDACEGFNPTHDVCRLITDTAIALACRACGQSIASYAFPLDGPPVVDAAGAIRISLDDAAFARKLAAAHGYADLRGEVDDAFTKHGVDAFRTECLVPVEEPYSADRFADAAPYYEQHGERQVAAGFYTHVIRYRDHVAPLAEALRRHAEGER